MKQTALKRSRTAGLAQTQKTKFNFRPKALTEGRNRGKKLNGCSCEALRILRKALGSGDYRESTILGHGSYEQQGRHSVVTTQKAENKCD